MLSTTNALFERSGNGLANLGQTRSPFEHFWTIRALLLHARSFTETIARVIYDTLIRLEPEIRKDPGRVNQSPALKARALSKLVSSSGAGEA
jgi:hypothetical protein